MNQPRWTPASLNDGSTWIFDPDDLTTFTMSAADSILCTAISNLFGGGITGTISVGHVLPANPYFGGRNTLALRGGTSRVSMNLLDKFKNVPAITLCSLIRLPTLTVTATPPPE